MGKEGPHVGVLEARCGELATTRTNKIGRRLHTHIEVKRATFFKSTSHLHLKHVARENVTFVMT